jgi:GMP synthase (glutamine-hydrolysing)
LLPIAILQNDESVPAGLLGESLARRQVPVECIEVFRGQSLPDLGEVSGVAILGGRMGAYEEAAHPFLKVQKEMVRSAVDLNVPVLGICLGCQIIADAQGGRAYRVEPQEAGLVDLRLTEDGLGDPMGMAVEGPMVSWHNDSWDLPPGGSLLAVSDQYPQAFRVGSAVGVQFHPEVTIPILEGWLNRDGDSLLEVGLSPDGFLDAVRAVRLSLHDRADRLFGAWVEEVSRFGS